MSEEKPLIFYSAEAGIAVYNYTDASIGVIIAPGLSGEQYLPALKTHGKHTTLYPHGKSQQGFKGLIFAKSNKKAMGVIYDIIKHDPQAAQALVAAAGAGTATPAPPAPSPTGAAFDEVHEALVSDKLTVLRNTTTLSQHMYFVGPKVKVDEAITALIAHYPTAGYGTGVVYYHEVGDKVFAKTYNGLSSD